jgi:hypothetical protein
MNVFAKNKRTAAALGVVSTEFKFYRAGSSHWRVRLKDGSELNVVAPNLATESTVLRLAAAQLAKAGRAVVYPKEG